jgi:hypothetical protein
MHFFSVSLSRLFDLNASFFLILFKIFFPFFLQSVFLFRVFMIFDHVSSVVFCEIAYNEIPFSSSC